MATGTQRLDRVHAPVSVKRRLTMAHLQSQTHPASSTSSDRKAPAARSQSRGDSLVPRDPRAWAASPFGVMRRLSDDLDELFGQLVGGAAIQVTRWARPT